jgi:DNA-binding winged helix-turn-helix (wHTH) protein/tetratricopeptide (TPR) repeat protein/TolB-like protein
MPFLYRFGPFELDPAEVSLCAGPAAERRAVALTRRAFDTLLYLVTHPGRLVGRDELIAAVWGETIVEEGNLHWTISAVRRALAQESPETFIETVRGRGYRFVAPVEAVDHPTPGAVPLSPATPPAPSLPAALSGTSAVSAGTAAPPPVERVQPAPSTPRWRWLAAGGFAALVLLALVGMVVSRRVLALEASGTAVAGFRNLSPGEREGWIGTALSEMLAADLARGGSRLVASDDVASLRRDLGLEPGAPLGRRELALLRRRLAAEWVVTGSYLVLAGSELRVDAQLRRTGTGEVRARASRRGRTGDLFAVTDALARDLARDGAGAVAGEPGETAGRGPGAAAAVPADPRAQRLYAEGLAYLQRMDARAAADRLEEAVAADPGFPGAWLALARASELVGATRRAEEAALAAVARSGNRPETERLAAEAVHLRLAQRRPEAVARLQHLYALTGRLEDGLALAADEVGAGQAQEALATVGGLRRTHPAAAGDARLDLVEADAFVLIEDFPRQRVAAERALTAARRRGMVQVEIRALRRLADVQSNERDPAGCRSGAATLATALRKAEALGDRLLVADVLHGRGGFFRDCQDAAAADESYRQAIERYREVGALGKLPLSLYNLGNSRLDAGDLLAADSLMREAMELCQAHGTRCRERFLHPLGVNRLHRGELAEARRLIEEGIELNRKLGNRNRVAEATGFLPDIAGWSGDLAQALEHARRVLALRQAIGSPYRTAWARTDLALWLVENGRSAEAATEARRALTLAAGQGDPQLTACAQGYLAFALLAAGDLAGADRESARALAQVRPPRGPLCSFQTLRVRAEVLLARGELDAAGALIDEGLELARRGGFAAFELQGRLLRARLTQARGHHAEAGRQAAELAEEARAKGFGLIAARAEALRAGKPGNARAIEIHNG